MNDNYVANINDPNNNHLNLHAAIAALRVLCVTALNHVRKAVTQWAAMDRRVRKVCTALLNY